MPSGEAEYLLIFSTPFRGFVANCPEGVDGWNCLLCNNDIVCFPEPCNVDFLLGVAVSICHGDESALFKAEPVSLLGVIKLCSFRGVNLLLKLFLASLLGVVGRTF